MKLGNYLDECDPNSYMLASGGNRSTKVAVTAVSSKGFEEFEVKNRGNPEVKIRRSSAVPSHRVKRGTSNKL